MSFLDHLSEDTISLGVIYSEWHEISTAISCDYIIIPRDRLRYSKIASLPIK